MIMFFLHYVCMCYVSTIMFFNCFEMVDQVRLLTSFGQLCYFCTVRSSM